MKIADFLVEIGVKADNQKVEQFEESVSGLGRALEALKFAAITAATKVFTDQSIEATVAIRNFANQTGIATKRVKEFVIAAELSDISMTAEETMANLSALQDQIIQITRYGEGNLKAFQLLGIDPRGNNALGVIEQLRQSIKGLDNATATNLIQQLGLSPNFINLLRLSREEFEKLYGNKVLLSGEQEKRILDLGTAYSSLSISLNALRDQVTASIAPAITALVRLFTKLIDNVAALAKWIDETVSPAFERMGKFATVIYENILKLIDGVVTFKNVLSAVIAGVSTLALGFSRLKILVPILAKAFAPLLFILRKILLPITAVFLLLDDLITFLSGGKSVIGLVLQALIDKFKDLQQWAGSVWDGFLAGLDRIGQYFQENLINPVRELIDELSNLFGLTESPEELRARVKQENIAFYEANKGKVRNAFATPNEMDFLNTRFLDSLRQGSNILGDRGMAPINNFNNIFNIQTSESSMDTAHSITRVMEQQLNRTQQTINNGPLN